MVINDIPWGNYTFQATEGPAADLKANTSEANRSEAKRSVSTIDCMLTALMDVFVRCRHVSDGNSDVILNGLQKHSVVSIDDVLCLTRSEFVRILVKECSLKTGPIIALWTHLTQDM